MKIAPAYAEDIIVIVKHKGKWQWYVTESIWWFLDLVKFKKTFEAKGYPAGHTDYSYRLDIAIVNEETADLFFSKIVDYKVETKELSEYFEIADYDMFYDLRPSVYVDFDKKELFSLHPEHFAYEWRVPDGWKGEYDDFTDKVPEEYRYWIIDGENYLEKDWESVRTDREIN